MIPSQSKPSSVQYEISLFHDEALWSSHDGLIERARELFAEISAMDPFSKIAVINELKQQLHEISPMRAEPVDCVLWVPASTVHGNDYNPNSVAPPEMKLLELSIQSDGYTQPIVTMREDDKREVIDGFHRHLVGQHSDIIRKRIMGYLPVVTINQDRVDKGDRMSATIRHNRARGKHKVEGMSDIVIELKRRNWSDEKICRELGMEQDEVLRLCQITGLSDLFSDQEFSKSWDVEGEVKEEDFIELTDDAATYPEEDTSGFRTVNTSDENRIFHPYEKWECYAAGFYATTKDGMTKAQCQEAYRKFLADSKQFASALEKVIAEWKHSCEHYLTNSSMNRIAWLGQASACYSLGIPATYRSGFWLLSEEQQNEANKVALEYLNKWMAANGREPVSMADAISEGRQVEIY